jgi:hypothetical protein
VSENIGDCPGCLRAAGHPFDPAWRTTTVVLLARGILQDRAFDRMPILADALQDAGCEDEDILNHCRHATEHIAACWVLALIFASAGTVPVPTHAPIPQPPPPPRFQQATQSLKQAGKYFALGVVFTPVLLFLAVLCLVLIVLVMLLFHRSTTQPIPAVLRVDPINSPFTNPEEKIVLLRQKLNKLRADPNANPEEIKQTEASLAYWTRVANPPKAKPAAGVPVDNPDANAVR